MNPPNISKRDHDIYLRRERGETLQSIADSYQTSRQRIEQIVKKAELKTWEYENRHSLPFYGLSVRAHNALVHCGINTRDEARTAIDKGVLRPNNPSCRGYGMTVHYEVCGWLGIKPPASSTSVFCPNCGHELPTDYNGRLKKL